MDITADVQHRGSEGCSEANALFEWQHMDTEGKVVCQGEGANLQLWMPKPNPRFRDVTTCVDGACEEGRKAIRDDHENEKSMLMEFAHLSATRFGHASLKGGCPALENVSHSSPTKNECGYPMAHHLGDAPIGKTEVDNQLGQRGASGL